MYIQNTNIVFFCCVYSFLIVCCLSTLCLALDWLNMSTTTTKLLHYTSSAEPAESQAPAVALKPEMSHCVWGHLVRPPPLHMSIISSPALLPVCINLYCFPSAPLLSLSSLSCLSHPSLALSLVFAWVSALQFFFCLETGVVYKSWNGACHRDGALRD